MRRRYDRPQSRSLFRAHHSAFIVCFLVFLFSLSICVSFGNAWEKSKPKIQEWQINGILGALDDGYTEVKQTAFEKLGEFSSKDLRAFPKQSEEIGKRAIDTIKKSEKEDFNLRYSAVRVLGNTGRTDNTVVQILLDILGSVEERSDVRGRALEALGNIGKTNTIAVQFLTDAFKNKEVVRVDDRLEVAMALENTGRDETAVQFIIDVLKNSEVDSNIRIRAAEALGNVDKADDTVVQALTNVLKNSNTAPDLRVKAAEALGNLGKADDTVVLALTNILKNGKEGSFNLHADAIKALGSVGKANDTAIKVLTDILANSKTDSYIIDYYYAAEALGNTRRANDMAVQAFTNILRLRDSRVDSFLQGTAIEALGNIGKGNDTAIQVLTNVVKDKTTDPNLRVKATKALGNLQQLTLGDLFILIERLEDGSYDPPGEMRFTSYYYGRGENEIKILLKWLGSPKRMF